MAEGKETLSFLAPSKLLLLLSLTSLLFFKGAKELRESPMEATSCHSLEEWEVFRNSLSCRDISFPISTERTVENIIYYRVFSSP